MKLFVSILIALGYLIVAGSVSARPPVSGATFLEQMSYALGYDIAHHLGGQVDLDLTSFIRGAKDAGAGTSELSEEQLKEMLMAYRRLAQKKMRDEAQAQLQKNRAEGRVFFEGNKLKEGVVTLSSGLQYKVVTAGDGAVPKPGDSVECRYRGHLIDGREFDATDSTGRAAVIQVDKVIPGFREALLRMPVGSKWILYIPSDLAYGDQGAGEIIEPGHTLIFELALLSILN